MEFLWLVLPVILIPAGLYVFSSWMTLRRLKRATADCAGELHWTERSRVTWSYLQCWRVTFAIAPFLGGFVIGDSCFGLTWQSALNGLLVFAGIWFGLLTPCLLIEDKLFHRSQRHVREIAAVILMQLMSCAGASALVALRPESVGGYAVSWVVATCLLVAFWNGYARFGLCHALGLLRPANALLTARVATLAGRHGLKPPPVYVSPSSNAEASAHVLIPSVTLSTSLLEILSDDELDTIVEHELAHLAEPRWATYLRALSLFVWAPVILWFALADSSVDSLADPSGNSVMQFLMSALVAWGSTVVLSYWFNRFLSVPLENRADHRVSESVQAGAYGAALEKIYRHNYVPAVLRGRHTHPDLYDRLLAIGVEPAYDRPKPPPRRMLDTTVVCIVWIVLLALALFQSDNILRETGVWAFDNLALR